MKKMFQVLMSIVKYLLIIIGVFMLLSETICGFGQKSIFFPYVRTKVSERFSKDVFLNNITAQQSKEDVIKYLGEPYRIDTLGQDYCANKHYYRMIYSKEDSNKPFNFAWCMFIVYLDDNFNVVDKEEFWYDD